MKGSEIFLLPGDFYFGNEYRVIKTLLGSCVSITMWSKRLKLGGMCHYKLPRRPVSPSTRLDGNPYRDWLEMYADAEYQQVARAEVAQLDRLFASRGGPGREAALSAVFATATRLEIGFWQMGLDAA